MGSGTSKNRPGKSSGERDSLVTMLRSAFDRFDVNGNGAVESVELSGLFEVLDPFWDGRGHEKGTTTR